jgi:hypothetical protein
MNLKEFIGFDPNHLENVNETYREHGMWCLKAFFKLQSVAWVGLMHGIFPFLFAETPDKMVAPWVRRFIDRRERTGQAARREL